MNKLPLHTKVQIKLKTGFVGLGKGKNLWHKCLRDNNSSSTKCNDFGFQSGTLMWQSRLSIQIQRVLKGTNARQRFTKVEKSNYSTVKVS